MKFSSNSPSSSTTIDRLKKKVQPIIPPSEFKRINVYDIRSNFTQKVAYTTKKQNIYLCTRSKDGKIEDDDVLTYVLLHEYSHALCNDCHMHDTLFDHTFEKLLIQARNHGISFRNKKTVCGKCTAGNCN
ncbi:MAG: hypothetical protein N2B06_04870 [Clostridium sp.]